MTKEVAATGEMPMPKDDDQILGGHAVQACGYDDARKVFIVRNSWGEGWGDRGYFYMPYAYLSDAGLASDMWVMRSVDGTPLPTEAISTYVPSAAPLRSAAPADRQLPAEA